MEKMADVPGVVRLIPLRIQCRLRRLHVRRCLLGLLRVRDGGARAAGTRGSRVLVFLDAFVKIQLSGCDLMAAARKSASFSILNFNKQELMLFKIMR